MLPLFAMSITSNFHPLVNIAHQILLLKLISKYWVIYAHSVWILSFKILNAYWSKITPINNSELKNGKVIDNRREEAEKLPKIQCLVLK